MQQGNKFRQLGHNFNNKAHKLILLTLKQLLLNSRLANLKHGSKNWSRMTQSPHTLVLQKKGRNGT